MKGHPRRDLERETAQGYRLEQVVADLVDNCVDAGAENIEVIFNDEQYNGRDSHYLIVLDDGCGILPNLFSQVMDLGVERVYDELDLGKFGVGMKSSSLSQAKEITVLTKIEGGEIELRRLSFEIVWERDEWVLTNELLEHMKTHAIDVAMEQLNSRASGTAVVLEDMHKLDLQVGYEDQKKEYLNAEYAIIREYLSLVFERYLGDGITLKRKDGTSIHRCLKICFNGQHDQLTPLDPFCRDYNDGTITGTLRISEEVSIQVEDNHVVTVPISIWITPKSNDREKGFDGRLRTASRDLSIRELQGMYIYRNGRLIDFPGWKRLLKVEEHMTCLRWEINFPPVLDSAFQLDPSKREVKIPMILREHLAKLTTSKFRWHPDDEKAVNHRARARIRQSGKDAVIKVSGKPKTTKKNETQKSGTIKGEKVLTTKPTSAQPLKKIKLEEIPGSTLGKVIINEKQLGDTWFITLNSNHAMFKEFIKQIRER